MEIVKSAMYKVQTMRHSKIKEELTLRLKKCRDYARAYRGGAFDYLNHYPCGYQDAHAAEVDHVFNELESFKVAYQFINGKPDRLMKHVNNAIQCE